MALPPTSTTPMTVDEAKHFLNLSTLTTTYDAYIQNNLFGMAKWADDYCNGGLRYDFEPTDTQYTALAASSVSTSTSALIMPWLASVVVFSSDEAKVYTEDHDYEIDYENGSLVYLANSTYGTSTGGYALVHYQFIYPQGGAKAAVAQLIRYSMENDPSVASESIGPLSRTYTNANGDIPGPIKRMLNPYRKPLFR